MYTEISESLIHGGKALLYTLFSTIKDNFDDMETRIAALEATVAQIPVGIIMLRGNDTPTTGFLLCDGTAISRNTYSNLFDVIGTLHGVGDGSTTFNLPDLRGRAPIGSGTGSGLTARTTGTLLGEETHLLTTAEIAAHTHTVTDAGHAHTYPRAHNNTGVGSGVLPIFWNSAYVGNFNSDSNGSPTASATTGISINSAGGDGAHNNMQPSLVCNFMIKT
jgi:microcystin-dependent protein